MTTKTPGLATTPMLAHHRLILCAVVGAVVGIAWPDVTPLSRLLAAWNVTVWLYLAFVAVIVWRARPGHMKQIATAQAESAATVLAVVVAAAVVSLVAVVLELSAAKAAGPKGAASHIAFAFATVVGSWLVLPVLFSLTYAARYFGMKPGGGLDFPGATKSGKAGALPEPEHGDFLYFSFTIAVACQTADVAITSPEMRRIVLGQALLSFVFNTTILAFTINAAAQFF